MVDLKSMSNKEKAEYIWDYYKLPIIGVLAVMFVIGSFIYSQVTKIDYVFNLTMVGNAVDENKTADLGKQITNLVVKQGEKKKQAIVDFIPTDTSTDDASEMSNEYMQKFIVKLAAGDLDIVVLDKNIFESLAKQDAFTRLDNISGLDLTSIKNEKVEANGSDSFKHVYGISAEEIKAFKDIGFDTNNKVIGIINTSKQKDKAVLVLKWLLSK